MVPNMDFSLSPALMISIICLNTWVEIVTDLVLSRITIEAFQATTSGSRKRRLLIGLTVDFIKQQPIIEATTLQIFESCRKESPLLH